MRTYKYTIEWKTINYGPHSCLEPKRRHRERAKPPQATFLHLLWLGSSVWQCPANAGGLSRACSPWEEVSLNIWLLIREELYTREVATWASGKRGSSGPVESHRVPGGAATLSQQMRALAEYTRALFQGRDFPRAEWGSCEVSSCVPRFRPIPQLLPPPGLGVNLQSSRPGISPLGFSLCPAGLGPRGP